MATATEHSRRYRACRHDDEIVRWESPHRQRTSVCPLWVKSGHRDWLKECLLCPSKRTSIEGAQAPKVDIPQHDLPVRQVPLPDLPARKTGPLLRFRLRGRVGPPVALDDT